MLQRNHEYAQISPARNPKVSVSSCNQSRSSLSPARQHLDTYVPIQQPRPDLKAPEDKNAYMTFLEIQLERISQTCANQQKSNDSIQNLNQKVKTHDEKLTNIQRLIKLLQSYSDAQEDDTHNIQSQINQIQNQIRGNSQTSKRAVGDQQEIAEQIKNHFQVFEAKFVSQNLHVLNQRHEEQENRINRLEKLIQDQKKATENGKRKSPTRFAKQKQQKFGSRLKASGLTNSGSTLQEDIQSGINEWLDKIEIQINQIEDQIHEKAAKSDLEELDFKFDRELRALKSATAGAENLANRLTDDALRGQEELREMIQHQDFRITEMASWQEGKQSAKAREKATTMKGGIKKSEGERLEQMLEALEERVTSRIADSVESLGGIIEEYANKYQRLSEKIKVIEGRGATGKTVQGKTARSAKKFGVYQPPVNLKIVQPKRAGANLQKPGSSKVSDKAMGAKPSPKLSSDFQKSRYSNLRNSFEVKLNNHIQDQPNPVDPNKNPTAEFINELEQEPQHLQDQLEEMLGSQSPRSAFKRARDKSLKDLTASQASEPGKASAKSRSVNDVSPTRDFSHPYENHVFINKQTPSKTESARYQETSASPTRSPGPGFLNDIPSAMMPNQTMIGRAAESPTRLVGYHAELKLTKIKKAAKGRNAVGHSSQTGQRKEIIGKMSTQARLSSTGKLGGRLRAANGNAQLLPQRQASTHLRDRPSLGQKLIKASRAAGIGRSASAQGHYRNTLQNQRIGSYTAQRDSTLDPRGPSKNMRAARSLSSRKSDGGRGNVRLHQRLAADLVNHNPNQTRNSINRTSKSATKRPCKSSRPKAGQPAHLRSRSRSIEATSAPLRQRKKAKVNQTRRANDRLQRLEKMYQELTDIENMN